MKPKAEQQSDLKLKQETGAASGVLVSQEVGLQEIAVSNEHANTSPKLQRAKPSVFGLLERIFDNLLVSSAGALLAFASVWIFAHLIGSSVPIIDVADLAMLAGFSVFIIYFACGGLIWLGAVMLFLQLTGGAFVGRVVVDVFCNWLQVDPLALGPWYEPASASFTFLFAILPVVASPLYVALMESSPLRRTLAAINSELIVVDLKGNRLGFRQALKRQVFAALSSFLYPLSIALGKKYRDKATWLEQSTGTIKIKKELTLRDEIDKSKDRVSVRYRAFKEIESVLVRENQNLPKVMKKIDVPFRRALNGVFAMAVLTMYIGLPTLLQAPSEWMRYGIFSGNFQPLWITAAGTAIGYVTPLPLLFVGFAGLAMLYLFLAACRPTHIEMTKSGLRFVFGGMPLYMQDRLCAWKEVKAIYLEMPKGKVSAADQRLVFEKLNGSKMRLRLSNIGSAAGKDEILKAVERWSPSTPRTPEAIGALQPPADFSYTELWMEALTAPPKREKLKPLSSGAVLREHQYTITRMLGVGGQGTAYLAEDAVSSQFVVLKEFVLPVYVEVGVRRKALSVFENEARLLKDLSHPNVVKLIDYFVEDHRAYLVLEHIDGASLRQIVNKSGRMSEDEVLKLMIQMTEILEYLHGQSPPVVHRDFTPDNLILRKDGTLKLIDFNVAQQTDSADVSSVVGKTAYLPPEQFRGSPGPRSDIYAMGGCAQFLLTGEDPVAILSSDPRVSRPEVSDKLALVVQRATEPELANRFKSAQEVRGALGC